MGTRKIVVEIDSEGVISDADVDDYVDAIKDACDKVEGRAMIAPETRITVRETVGEVGE